MLVEHRQTVDTQLRPQVALGKKIRGGEIKTPPYSGKVLEEENFCELQALVAIHKNFLCETGGGHGVFWRRQQQVIHKSFLCENVIFHKFTKVYFLESFPLYGNHRGG